MFHVKHGTQRRTTQTLSTKCEKPFDGLAEGLIAMEKSGRLDLNQRPLRPERSALARLSYAPSLNAAPKDHENRTLRVTHPEQPF
jgi:hypothetical protein